MNVEWQNTISHDALDWDLFFSSDGGFTWDSIQMDIPTETLSFLWIVPEISTTEGRIRIMQDNVETDYEDISENFTITPVTGINERFTASEINAYPNPLTDFATISFDNPRHESHTLAFYNIQGRLTRTITNITTDKVKVKRENLPSGLYFYQLRTDEAIRATGNLIVK